MPRTTAGQRWPLGSSDESYRLTDLLIVDHEEALRLSGCTTIPEAMNFFIAQGTKAVLVTNGARDVYLQAVNSIFSELQLTTMPVSEAVTRRVKQGEKGDSTGCGDNFAGGAIASLCWQLSQGREVIDLREAARWGIVSGGFACFYYGGTYFEQTSGEKLSLLQPLYAQYLEQTATRNGA